MHIRALVFGVGFALVGVAARGADAPPPVVARGTIASIDAKSVSIKKADGTSITASLTPSTAFATVEPRRFEQIKATDFVGITSVPGPNDTLKAEEVHIIAQKGLNEGSYPWDRHPDGVKPAAATSMTNGTVTLVHDEPPVTYTMTNANVTASSSMQLKVTYQGSAMVAGKCVGRADAASGKACTGVATVELSPSTPIVAIVPASSVDAKPGLAVFAIVAVGAQGKPVVRRLIVEKNGVKPPL